MTDAPSADIACTQVLLEDATVLSVQWTDLPAQRAAGLTPQALLAGYLEHIRRVTLGVVRPVETAQGLAFRLAGVGTALLRFRCEPCTPECLVLALDGGLLREPRSRGSGELSFACEPAEGGVRAVIRLSGFVPRLLGPAPGPGRKALYRFTQAAIHKRVTVGFLARLQRERAGGRICCRVVKVQAPEGEEI